MGRELNPEEREMLALLPEEPRAGLREWALSRCRETLGGDVTVFCRESYAPEDWVDWGYDMDPRPGKRRWAAACDCSACGDRYYTAWGRDSLGRPGIAFRAGDDGQLFDGWFDNAAPDCFTAVVVEGEQFDCPVCGATTSAVHVSSLRRGGRTYACLFGTVERLGDFGALLFWLIRRHVDEYAVWETEVWPRSALVIGRDGKTHRFGHTVISQYGERLIGHWEPRRSAGEPEQLRYYCYGNGTGRNTRNTIGAFWWDEIPDLSGTTAEKTGLDVYVRDEGAYPALYLELWRKHRNAENLVRAGFTQVLSSAIEYQAEAAHRMDTQLISPKPPALNWDERRPSKMLGTDRAQLRRIAAQRWDWITAELWIKEKDRALRGVSAEELGAWAKAYSARTVAELTVLPELGGGSVGTALRYLDRQDGNARPDTRARLLLDYRRMLCAELDGRAPARDELWPPRLLAAHDRLAERRRLRGDPALTAAFEEAAERYAALAWTDGRLCIVIPRREEDLIAEGETLHHCVGGYGKSHCAGRPVFFVRHARRPERSWFTLNEDLRETVPQRIQLHGYRNELYVSKAPRDRRVPREVLAFVERWEREVLAPWQAERLRKEAEKPKKKRGNRPAA